MSATYSENLETTPKSVSSEVKLDEHRHFEGLRGLIADLDDPTARTELTSLLRDFVEKFQVHSRLARRRQVAHGVSPEGTGFSTGVTPEVQKSVDAQDAAAKNDPEVDPDPDEDSSPPVVADSRANVGQSSSSVFVNEQPQIATPQQPVSSSSVEGTPVTHP
jgi:hypothetical protein